MKVNLKHKDTGVVKTAPLGFSWTTLFFGIFVPLIRGDIKWFIISLVIAIVTAGLGWFVIPFIYNKIYIKNLIEKGYVPADEASKQALIEKGIIAS
jgi:hypothetical protein